MKISPRRPRPSYALYREICKASINGVVPARRMVWFYPEEPNRHINTKLEYVLISFKATPEKLCGAGLNAHAKALRKVLKRMRSLNKEC